MAEYISRDKALKVIDALDDISDAWGCAIPMHTIKEKIKEIPSADVRPVVLCKDCKHRPAKKDGRIKAPEDADGYTDYNCPFVCDDSWYNRMPADDDYCSLGEKREET